MLPFRVAEEARRAGPVASGTERFAKSMGARAYDPTLSVVHAVDKCRGRTWWRHGEAAPVFYPGVLCLRGVVLLASGRGMGRVLRRGANRRFRRQSLRGEVAPREESGSGIHRSHERSDRLTNQTQESGVSPRVGLHRFRPAQSVPISDWPIRCRIAFWSGLAVRRVRDQ